MTETSTAKDYFKKCFEPKQLIQKGIIAGAALIIVLSLSLSFYMWLKDVVPGTDIGVNGFWYLHIIWNDGIGWNVFSGNPAAIYVVQTFMFLLLLAVFLLLCHDRVTASFVALAMFGGLFNLIQRGASGTNMVLDYFQFGFWPTFPVFNWPDTCVVIGVFGFVISFITVTIIQAVRESQNEKRKKDEQH